MNDAAPFLFALAAFAFLLVVGYRIFEIILGTDDEHRVEPDPNEWATPRQRQPLR